METRAPALTSVTGLTHALSARFSPSDALPGDDEHPALAVPATHRETHYGFSPLPTKNVSDDLSLEALGLRSTTRRKCRLKFSTICEKPLP